MEERLKDWREDAVLELIERIEEWMGFYPFYPLADLSNRTLNKVCTEAISELDDHWLSTKGCLSDEDVENSNNDVCLYFQFEIICP